MRKRRRNKKEMTRLLTTLYEAVKTTCDIIRFQSALFFTSVDFPRNENQYATN